MFKSKQNKNNLEISSVVAQKCPVCNGFGTLKWGQLTCHGCRGKGFITISISIDRKKNGTQDT